MSDPANPVRRRPGALWLLFSSGVLGALIGPVALFVLFFGMAWLDRSCANGGNEGGCAMGVFAGTVAGVPIGLFIGLVVGIVRALRRPRV